MSKELSSGIETSPSRALLKSLGLSDEEIANPIIAVISAYSQADACGAGLNRIAAAVADGIRANGGTPLTVPALSTFNCIAGGSGAHYELPFRELIADGVESLLSSNAFDGAVLVTGSDESVPGMIMGAVRANIPTVAIACGPMASGVVNGVKCGMADVYKTVGKVKSGKASITELSALENGACQGVGSFNEMYSTNALNCVCEALGLSLPGNGSIPSASAERIRLAKRTGEAVMKLVENDVRPRMILTKDAFINAFTVLAAIGGDTNAMLHLFAVAAECETDPKRLLSLDAVAEIASATPLLCKIDGKFDMGDYYASGGTAAVINQLNKKGLIKGDCQSVSGAKTAAMCADCEISGSAIASADSPVLPYGGFKILKGNIADDGAVIKCTEANANKSFVGKAKCFDSEQECYAAITGGNVSKGDVLVIRYEGPFGGPGMSAMLLTQAAINGMGLSEDVAIVTDGRLGGIDCAWAVGHVCPEAAAGGKLAYVKNGDKITIDVKGGRLNLDITAKELQARIKKYRPRDDEPSGWLLRYKYAVTTAAQGCVLKKKF